MRGKCALLVGMVSLCGAAAGCGLHEDGLSLVISVPGEGGAAGTEPAPLPAGGTGGVAAAGGAGGSGMATGGTGGMPADGPGGSAGDPPDAGQPPAPDAMPPIRQDASRPEVATVSSGTIECGATRCDADNEVCCAGAAGATSCAPRNDTSCGAVASARRCDGPEDCDGERVCCAQAALIGSFRTTCLKPSECVNLNGAAICRNAADCFDHPYRICAASDFSGSMINTCHRE
jgi:hypothetical protein